MLYSIAHRTQIDRAYQRFARAWEDPSGVRRILRHHLAHPVAIISTAVLIASALADLGTSHLLALLAGLVAGQVGVDIAYGRTGHPIPPDRRFRVSLVTWPLGLILLGAAGWAPSGAYFGEVVALIALMVAGLVALVEPFWFAASWSMVAAAALALGALTGGPFNIETFLPVGAIIVGTVFATSLRQIVEGFLGQRRRVLLEIASHPIRGNAFSIAARIIEPLFGLAQARTVSLFWFTDDDRTLLLASGGAVPPGFTPGVVLPPERNADLREHAATGPWIVDWTRPVGDEAYHRNIARSGISAVAYVPIRDEGRLIGLLGAGAGDAAGGVAALAELLPILVDVAEVAGVALAPRLLDQKATSAADALIERILRERQFWPVFQPVRDLSTNRIVGYEALSRFDAPGGPQAIFAQALLAGRLRELELATLEAALDAAKALPPDAWLSVNSSAALLAEGDALEVLLSGVHRSIVVELSEHDVVDDYGPITASIDHLGPRRTLAVDDAGAGFASLRHILESRPAYVKLDIGLVQGVASDISRRALVAGFVRFARDGGFQLIAEGIETAADLSTLRMLGVELGQGYLLGRPEQILTVRATTRAS